MNTTNTKKGRPTIKRPRRSMHPYQAEQHLAGNTKLEVAQPKGEQPNEKAQRPAQTFTFGMVATRVWKNVSRRNKVSWRIDQRRIYFDSRGGTPCKTFAPEHVADAVRGLKVARRWIKKQDRRLLRNLLATRRNGSHY